MKDKLSSRLQFKRFLMIMNMTGYKACILKLKIIFYSWNLKKQYWILQKKT